MTTSKIMPGLIDDHCEVFKTGSQLMATYAGSTLLFADLPKKVLRQYQDALEADSAAKKALIEWGVPPSRWLERFVECRFGGVDHTPDLSSCGQLSPDYHDCGRRGQCPFEGRICKNPTGITKRERETLVAIAQGLPQKQVADKLGISEVTVSKHRKKLFEKTGAQCSVELAVFAHQKNYV